MNIYFMLLLLKNQGLNDLDLEAAVKTKYTSLLTT